MVFCVWCGGQLADTAKFCIHCGKAVATGAGATHPAQPAPQAPAVAPIPAPVPAPASHTAPPPGPAIYNQGTVPSAPSAPPVPTAAPEARPGYGPGVHADMGPVPAGASPISPPTSVPVEETTPPTAQPVAPVPVTSPVAPEPSPSLPGSSAEEAHFEEMASALVQDTHGLEIGGGDDADGFDARLAVENAVAHRSLNQDLNTGPVDVPTPRSSAPVGSYVNDDVGKRVKPLVRILSIDGGGIRGVMPAIVLDYLEKSTGRRISDMFDFLAGTSTGGLLALGMTVPSPQQSNRPLYTAQDALQLYYNRGKFIFTADRTPRRPAYHDPYNPYHGRAPSEGIIDKMARKTREGMREAMGKAMLACKYGSQNIETVLSEYFGNCRLSQALRPLLIPAYEIERRHPFLFKSQHARSYGASCDFEMRAVARATSAAPLYFPPVKISAHGGGYHALVDGGIVANNPAMLAYAECQTLYPDSEFMVVSLGTGQLDTPILYDDAVNFGIAGWASPLVDSMFTGSSDCVDYQLAQILNTTNWNNGGQRYYRFTAILNKDTSELDDTSPKFFREITSLTQNAILHKRQPELQTLVRHLAEN